MSSSGFDNPLHRSWIRQARIQFDAAEEKQINVGLDDRSSDAAPKSHAIPGYALEREIHRGGQGTVYRAVQKGTGRRVALKLLHEQALGGPLERARFEREMHVLASLQHPNIVAIHDGGSHDGRFYLVMDYIAGQPLDDFIAARDLSIRDTIALFVQVCEAVNAAHLRGVIHRDIKPANVRVSDEGRPFVLDFGLAKLVQTHDDDSSVTVAQIPAMTLTGQFLGSLPWAAPEQADGSPARIDVRTDVYALGVVLYQLLTGHFPYPVNGPMKQTLDAIVHRAPVPPGTIRAEIDDELETIVLKCLQKEPARRYQSAGDLARDLQRYLGGEPIEAKRDSPTYLLRKALRRHWIPASVAAAFLLVVSVGLIVSLSQWRNAVRERNEAHDARESERAALRQAADEADRAQSANEFLQNMLTSADPSVSLGRDLTVREVLDAAADRVERGELKNQPRVEAAVRHTLGRSYLSLGHMEVAEQEFKRALQIIEQLDGPKGRPYGETLCWIGVLERRRANLAESERWQREALAVFQALIPEDPEMVAMSLAELAYLSDLGGRRDDGLAFTEQAITLYRKVLPSDHPTLVTLESVLAARAHDHGHSVEQAQRSVESIRSHYGDRHPEMARALTRLACAHLATPDVPRAIETQERAVALLRDLFGADNPETLFAIHELVLQYRMCDREDKAIAMLEPLLLGAEKVHGPCSETRLTFLICKAAILKKTAGFEEVEQAYQAIVNADDCPEWATSPLGVNARFALAETYLERGKCEEAAPMLAACQAAADAKPGQTSPGMLARIGCLSGELYTCRREFQQAETSLLEAHARVAKSIMTGRRLRERIIQAFVKLYEAWDAAEPGSGKADKAVEWRAMKVTMSNDPP